MRSLYPKGKEPGLLDPGSFYPLIPSGFTRMTLLGYSVNRGNPPRGVACVMGGA